MKKAIGCFVFFAFITLACQGDGRQGKRGKGKDRTKDKTVEELTQEVLDKAATCSEALKKDYEQKIANQKKALTEQKIDEKGLKKSLRNMKKTIKC